MSSKRYPGEFKIDVVKQVVELGYSVAQVARRLGTTTHSLSIKGRPPFNFDRRQRRGTAPRTAAT